MQENDGDLFQSYIDSFQFMIKDHRNKEHKNFFRNAFLNMNYKLENTLANNLYEEGQKNQYFHMINLINRKNLNIKEEQELHQVLRIMMSITFHNLVQVFVKDLSNEEALKNYREQIQLLKRGLHKNEGHSI